MDIKFRGREEATGEEGGRGEVEEGDEELEEVEEVVVVIGVVGDEVVEFPEIGTKERATK